MVIKKPHRLWLRTVVLALVIIQLIASIPLSSVFASPSDMVVVSGSTVNIRSGAGENYPIVGSCSRGDMFPCLGEGSDSAGVKWFKIQYGNRPDAWVSGKYSSLVSLNPNDTNALIASIAKAYGAVGVQVALIENGTVTDTFNYGYATKSFSAMNSDTKVRVASISKVVIAMNAMKMQEQGKLDVNANIGKYWGSNPYKAVTLKSLLSHTSTLKDLGYSSSKAGTLSQLTSSASYNSGSVGSSSVWSYNNYGVGVAGTTLELAGGKLLDKYADENFFSGLGIDACWHPGSLKASNNIATLYRNGGEVARSVQQQQANALPSSTGVSTAYFAGGLTISAKDVAKLFAVLANDGSYNGVQYLQPSSVDAMETRLFSAGSFYQCMPLRYKANLYGESSLYYHTGNAYGMLALASYNPSTRNGVVVVTTGAQQNTDSNGIYSICGNITEQMYKLIAARAYVIPKNPASSIRINEQDISLALGETRQLTLSLDPGKADDTISWSSSSRSVTVDQNGKISATGYGTAVITAAGYSTGGSCTVSVVPDVDMKMLGASIRLSDPYGIRFGTQVIKDDVFDSLNIVEYGTIITGAGNLGGSELTLETQKMQRIKAVYLLSSDSKQLTYTGVIVNIPDSAFDTNLVGRGYLIYKDVDGIDHVIYTDTATRSFTGVAEAAYEKYSSSANPSASEQAMLEKLRKILGIEDEIDNIESLDPDMIADDPAVSVESEDTAPDTAPVPDDAPVSDVPDAASEADVPSQEDANINE